MLVIMLVDHIELYPSIFDYFTGRGRFFVSAAEGFFFLSGLLVGMVYRKRIARGARFVFARMWLRAAELYFLAAITTIGYALWATWANSTTIKYGLPNPADWGDLIKQTLLLKYGWGWADFLMRFCILMIAAPFAFYGLMRGQWRIVLSASVFLWVLRGQNFTYAWQLLFIGGMVAGYYWLELSQFFNDLQPKTARVLKSLIYTSAAVTFAISYFVVYGLSYLNAFLEQLPPWLTGATLQLNWWNEVIWRYAEKWTLGPLRVTLFLLWFSALFMLINKNAGSISRLSGGSLDLLGRNSLFVYLLHSFIVFIFHLYIIPDATNRWQNFVITGTALVLLIGGTIGYKRLRTAYPNFVIKNVYTAVSRPFKSIT